MPTNLINLISKTEEINLDEKQCMQALINEWKETRPLLHKKILMNCHLTTATLMLVELFILAGAEFKITCIGDLVCHEPIKEVVDELGIYLDLEHVAPYQHYFDVVIDCGAHLANILHPKKGFVELTHVDESYYQTIEYPIISVDDSTIKLLETTYGTGDGFVRAIDSLYLQRKEHYQEKNYMIFGFGKVGKGICSCLVEGGVLPKNIIVIEKSEPLRHSAKDHGFQAYSPRDEKLSISELLHHHVHCAVTATGIKGCIAKDFTPEDFNHVEYLANMGTYDEWGKVFPKERILHQKQPLNFMLEYPTKIFYLDPIFALLACATLDMIENKLSAHNGIQKPNKTTERAVLDIWLQNNHVHSNLEWLWEEESKEMTLEQTYHTCDTGSFN